MVARSPKSIKALTSEIESVLAKRLKGFRSGLVPTERGERVIGYIVSSEFRGPDHGPRQRKLRQLLESAFDDSDLGRIGPIVTMSPTEADTGERAA